MKLTQRRGSNYRRCGGAPAGEGRRIEAGGNMRWLRVALAALMLTSPATAAQLRSSDLMSTQAVLH